MGNVSSPIWHQRKLITFSNHVWNVSNAHAVDPSASSVTQNKTKRNENKTCWTLFSSVAEAKSKTPTKQPVLRAAPNWQLLVSSFDKNKNGFETTKNKNENPTLKIAQPKRKMKRPVSDQVRAQEVRNRKRDLWIRKTLWQKQKHRARSHARRVTLRNRATTCSHI